jgi:GTP cyclohydrolase I
VVCEGTHLCMAMRGVEKQQSITTTSAMLGAFHDDARTRAGRDGAQQRRLFRAQARGQQVAISQ